MNSIVRSDRLKANVRLEDVNRQICEIQCEKEKTEYLRGTTPILNNYSRILNIPLRVEFTEGDKSVRDIEYNLIHEFLEVASRFCCNPIDYASYLPHYTQRESTMCPICRTYRHIVDTNGSTICKRCGLESKKNNIESTFSDATRMNMSGRYKYTKKSHFRDAINKFQGKDNRQIPDSVIDTIKKESLNHNLVKEKAKSEQGKYRRLRKEHILTFLKQNKLRDYYDDVNKIHNIITGKPLPDLTHLESALFKLHAQVEEAFESTKTSRKSFLHIQYVLMQLLRHLDYPCNEREFALPKTEAKLIEHDRDWKKICDVLGWEFHSTI